MNGNTGISVRKAALVAGISYVLIFVLSVFANFFVFNGLTVPGDAAATAANITENDLLFRIGTSSFIIVAVFDVVIAWALYVLLKPANRRLSLLTAWLRVSNAVILGVAAYHLLSVVQLLSRAGFLATLEPGQIQVQALLSLTAFNDTWLIGLVFFGVHLLFLGYLVFKAGYVSKPLGVLLVAAGCVYIIDSFAHFLLADYGSYEMFFLMPVMILGIVSELWFTLWLLIKGGKLSEEIAA